jgi:hypothetical protein
MKKFDNNKKVMTLILGGVFLGYALGYYLIQSSISKDWSLNFKRKHPIIEENYQKHRENLDCYELLWKNILGENGYADLNSDSYIDEREKVDAWRRMGLDPVIKEQILYSDTHSSFSEYVYTFSKPTIKDLERAVESYENESK